MSLHLPHSVRTEHQPPPHCFSHTHPRIFVHLLIRYHLRSIFFFFNDTATTEIYTLSLHDALPICPSRARRLFLQGNRCDHVDPHWHRDVLALACPPPVVFRAGKFFSRSLSVRCDFADCLLQGYFDGELSGHRAAEFVRPLALWVHCTTELVGLDLLRHILQLCLPY